MRVCVFFLFACVFACVGARKKMSSHARLCPRQLHLPVSACEGSVCLFCEYVRLYMHLHVLVFCVFV